MIDPAQQGLHELIDARAARTPDAIAVVSTDTTVTYATLIARATRLAHGLRGLSVGPEVRVAVCVNRAAHLVTALLAVLKAGGAFVPLDPSYPAERLAFMVRDSNARVLVTEVAVRARVPAHADVAVVEVDGLGEALAAERTGNPASATGGAHAAYVIYTSGSTGQPRAVLVPHDAVTNLARTEPQLLAIDATSRVLQFASAGFDAAVWEIFGTLAGGGTLVVPPREALLPGATLAETLRREQVSVVTLPPSVLAATDATALPALRTVVSAGEALPSHVAARWRAGRTVVNAYGPTETAVCACLAVCASDETPPPIGWPLPNVQLYVLDPGGRLLPAGVPGELCVGGVGLARGYLNHPAHTALRFVPDPFGPVRGGRLYRTGDRVRSHADGALEFLGRLDAQVKIRGVRVEPGEIEAALSAQPGVREARVVVREDTPGRACLVAYVVGDARGAALRAALKQRLPDVMVPAAVVRLDRLPLTVNGKLDVAALPRPTGDEPDVDITDPQNAIEAQLLHIWEELLGVAVRTPTQSFFDLGGDSLLAVRLLERVNRSMGCDLPVTTLFSGATIRQMAVAIERQQSAPQEPSSLVLLQPGGNRPPLFCVHAAGGKAIVYIDLVRHLGADRPIFGLEDLGDPSRPVARIASEYVEAVRSIRPEGPYHLAGWSFGGVVAYEMAGLLERSGQSVAFLGLLDTWEPALEEAWIADDVDLLIELGRELARAAGRPFSMAREELEPFGEDERIARLLSALHARGLVPRFEPKAIRDRYELPKARVVSARGRVLGRLDASVTLFRTTVDNKVDLHPACARLGDEERWTLGWSRVARHVIVHPVAGHHNTICQEPSVRGLAQQMRQVLAAADSAAMASSRPAAAHA